MTPWVLFLVCILAYNNRLLYVNIQELFRTSPEFCRGRGYFAGLNISKACLSKRQFSFSPRICPFRNLRLFSFLFCFHPPSLCCFSSDLAPLLRSEGLCALLRSLFPALFATFTTHFLHDFRNHVRIHESDCTRRAPVLPM